MSARGRWRGSTLPLLAALAAALVFVASLATTGRQLASSAMLEAAAHRIGFRESSQALREAARLATEIERLAAGEAAAAGAAALQRSLAVSALGLVVSATLLSALLFWLWRRASGLLEETLAARARARGSERLLRVVVDALPAMVSAHDREGRFLLANAALAAFHRTSEAALRGRDVTAATGAAEDAADLAAALASGTQLPFREVRATGPDGAERVLLSTAAPVAGDGGGASSVVRICLDITERKHAEE
jgi:PAS domain S-box-containing protein